MKLAIIIKKQNLEIDSSKTLGILRQHTRDYGWINVILLEKEPYTFDYFKQRLIDLLKTNFEQEYTSMLDDEAQLKSNQKIYMKKIRPYEELYHITKILQIFGFLRSFRVDVTYIGFGYCWNIVQEIAKRLEIQSLDIKHLESKEINKSLLKPNTLDYKGLISQRKQGILSIVIGERRYELIGKEIKKAEQYITLPKEETKDFVKGSIAYPGKVTGPCKILHKVEDMNKVQKGDIIVVSMTDPNYILAMERAAAFVTDFGGILCHAAIVSREMKKPCVIGTKNATKTFKDGDLIEVDAVNGFVRRL